MGGFIRTVGILTLRMAGVVAPLVAEAGVYAWTTHSLPGNIHR